MEISLIPLNRLHVSPLDMRTEKKEPSLTRIAEISANILRAVCKKGVLVALVEQQA